MPRIFNWLRNDLKTGDPSRIVPTTADWNKVANVLQDISGIGCRIEKPTQWDGRGWKIVVDGYQDEPNPSGEDGPYWYHTDIGIHPKAFANSDPTPAGDGTGALVLTAGGASFDHGLWVDLGDAFPADAAGTFTDDSAANGLRAEIVDTEFAGTFWSGYVSDLDWTLRLLICDFTNGVVGTFADIDGFVTKIVTGSEGVKVTDENLAAPNGFTAQLVTASEVGKFDNGSTTTEICNATEALYAYDASTFTAKLINATAAGIFTNSVGPLTATLCGSYALDAAGGVNSDGYNASGVPGIDYVSGAGTLSFKYGILVDATQFELDIISVIDAWVVGGGVDHGNLTGLDDNADHDWTWCNESPQDTYDTRNTAASGEFTSFMATPTIYWTAPSTPPYIDMANLMFYDTGGDLTIDGDARLLVNKAGTTVIDWNTGDVFTTGTGVARTNEVLTADATLDDTNHVVRIDASGGTVTATLPASPISGQEFRITCTDATNTVTIARNGNTLFGEAADFVLYEGETVILHYDSTEGWW